MPTSLVPTWTLQGLVQVYLRTLKGDALAAPFASATKVRGVFIPHSTLPPSPIRRRDPFHPGDTQESSPHLESAVADTPNTQAIRLLE